MLYGRNGRMWLCDFNIRIILNGECERQPTNRTPNHRIRLSEKERLALWLLSSDTNKSHRLRETDYTYEYEISIWIWMHELLPLLLKSGSVSLCPLSRLYIRHNWFCAYFLFPFFQHHKRCCLPCRCLCLYRLLYKYGKIFMSQSEAKAVEERTGAKTNISSVWPCLVD